MRHTDREMGIVLTQTEKKERLRAKDRDIGRLKSRQRRRNSETQK